MIIRLLTVLIAFSAMLCAADDTRPPNIVFMFADDLGFGDLSCYGHPYSISPALDKLAAEGTRFEDWHVTGVTCCPSRTGLMTGIWPTRFQQYPADFGFNGRITIADLLKTRGYATGHFGKWHMGPGKTIPNGTYGLDKIEIIGNDHDNPIGRDWPVFEAAIDFMKENADQPFYVNIWAHATHFPVYSSSELSSRFIEQKTVRSDFSDSMQVKFDECEEIGGDITTGMHQYLGDVLGLDNCVGRTMAVLDELGIADNTIVVFSSDHGPAPVILSKGVREHSKNMLGYAGIYRGGKHTQFEGGTRVPFIVRWPGKVPAGRVDDTNLLSFIDWLPTLCAIAGVDADKIPTDLDGDDMSPVWLGGNKERSKGLFWKASSTGSAPSFREGNWRLHLGGRKASEPMLYDIAKDPAETTNVADANPEILADLTAKLQAVVDSLPKTWEKREKKNRAKNNE